MACVFSSITVLKVNTRPVDLVFIPSLNQAAKRGSAPTKPKQSPRNSRPDSPRKSIGSPGGRDSMGDGDTADLEQRVMDVFVAFSSSVAKVYSCLAGLLITRLAVFLWVVYLIFK